MRSAADGAPTDRSSDDLHTAITRHRSGRWVVAAIVVVGAMWIVGPNVPEGPARQRLDALWWPATEVGFDQNWRLFSPDPRSQSLDVRARVEHADGTFERWDVPEFDPTVGALREYRWNKWQERVRLDARTELWDPTAEWIADRHRRDGELPVRVVLIRRWVDHEPLGDEGAVDSDWREFEFHVWEPSR